MTTLTSLKSGRIFLIALVVLVTVGMVLAPTADARRYLSNGGGSGQPGGGSEGDPLDNNDYNDDPWDDDMHDTASLVVSSPAKGYVVQAVLFGGKYLLGVDFLGGVPVMSIVEIKGWAATAEGTDAR
jgi:hypothetical protein